MFADRPLDSLALDVDFDAERIDADIAKFTRLEALSLRNVPADFVWPAALAKLRLRSLSISSPALAELPAVVCQLRSLEKLHLAMPMATLPDALSQLTVLRDLNLNDALTGVVPAVVGTLIRLERLQVAGARVPEQGVFDKLLRLKHLDLSRTNITSLSILHANQALESLVLDHVKTLETMEGIEALHRLTHLSLEGTRLREMTRLAMMPQFEGDLRADAESLEKYRVRFASRVVPSLEALISQLGTSDPAVLNLALEGLAARAALEPTALLPAMPVLEKALTRHLGALNPVALAKLASQLLTLNVPFAFTVARQALARGGDEAQLELVNRFVEVAVDQGLDAVHPLVAGCGLEGPALAGFLRRALTQGTANDDLLRAVTLIQLDAWATALESSA